MRHIAPFLLVAAGAFPLLALPPATNQPRLVVLAGLVFGAVTLTVLLVPWQRLPRWTQAIPAIAYLVVVGLLRHAEGGTLSGYAPLLLLPLFWVALYGSRRMLYVTMLACAGTLVIPLLAFGVPEYPTSDWRRVIVLLAVGMIVGNSVHELMARIRRHAREAEGRREEMAITEASLAAVGLIARELSHDSDVRGQVCEAAAAIGAADYAFILEPVADRSLVATSTAGLEHRNIEIPTDGNTAAAAAFRSGNPLRVRVGDSPPIEPAIVALGARTALYEPMLRHQEPVGVLCVAWREENAVTEGETMAVHLLATESAVAIERSDLLKKLDSMARSDALTGLPNRRAWEDALRRETARAERSGEQFALALLDLDHFKRFNDTRGHQAGDDLLQRLAAIWQLHLRDGDVLARWGGEEFAVLLPGCDEKSATQTVERLRATVPEGETCSAGLAVWSPGETPGSLVSRADEALYRAKEEGRDRTVAA